MSDQPKKPEAPQAAPPKPNPAVAASAPVAAAPPAPAPVKLTQEELIAAAVGKAVGEALPITVATAIKIQNDTALTARSSALQAAMATSERCAECRQLLVACAGKHKRMVVFPDNPRHGKWFPGCRLNGVLYISNNRSHYLSVPEGAAFEHMIQEWEHNEDEMYNGRTDHHDSGSVADFKPAHNAWR